MVNSRAKGARLEREAAQALRDALGLQAVRSARNGVPGAADVMVPGGLHVEVKGRRSIGAARFLDQALADKKPEDVPLVLMREDRGDWLVLLPLADVRRLLEYLSPARTV